MNIICKLFGHRWKGIITGFTHKGHPIGRCYHCNTPIVDDSQQAAEPMLDFYQKAREKEMQEHFNSNPK